MSLQNKMAEQLELDERRVKHAYQDSLGFWTIGIGRLIDKRKGGGLSDDEINYLLANDIKKRVVELNAALTWFSRLDEVRQGTLLNMSFQMGVDGLLAFKTTLGYVRDGHYGKAGEAMLKSLWARQTPERAQKMSKQMITGIWQ
jgi:lysozyme